MENFPRYFDRDLSWLSFNYRVLMEAKDESLPVYERLKFLAIYSSNLDEFFRVRVASIRSMLRLKKKQRKSLGIFGPRKLLRRIHEEVFRQQEEFGKIYREEILPILKDNNIYLIQNLPENETQKTYINEFFQDEVLPYVHPVILMKNKIAHFLRDKSLYLAVMMRNRSKTEEEDTHSIGKRRYAIVQIPTHYFSRFIQLPRVNEGHHIMFLDDIVRLNLEQIFPGFDIEECGSVKLSRDADLLIENEFSGNLVDQIKENLVKRQVGATARFLYDQRMSKRLLRYLRQTFNLKKEDLVAGARYHNFNDFSGFPNPLKPALERTNTPPLPHPELDKATSYFTALSEKNQILHFPYQTYDYVLRFLNEVAMDTHVYEIHTTQYRVASDSAIVNALINAARNGKKVTVFVEIKARFDEAANLKSAAAMEAAGIRVIYSRAGLKVHAKVALVLRKEGEQTKAYAFLSTGNFNEKTAKIYADHGLLTADQAITNELMEVFKHLQDKNYKPPTFNHLLVAQFNLRDDIYAKIDREITYAQEGKKAYICMKMNNLEDKGIIEKLYRASQAGVEIDLIIRGICCLRSGVEGMSENIRIRRIVDSYLEHARVFIFRHLGSDEMYIGSADMMSRNLNGRIEVVFPIYDVDIKAEIMHIVQLQLTDNVKAVELNANLENIRVAANSAAPVQAQLATYELMQRGVLGKEFRTIAG